jgi:hypothetical protein
MDMRGATMKKFVYEGLCSTRIAVLGCLLGLGAINTASAATLVLYDFSSGTTAAERLAATSFDSSLVSSASSFSFVPFGTNSYASAVLTQAGDVASTGGFFQYGPRVSGDSWTTSDRVYFSLTFATPVNLTSITFCNGSAGLNLGTNTQNGLCGGIAGNNTAPFGTYDLRMAAGDGVTTGGSLLMDDSTPGGGTPVVVLTDLSGNPAVQNLFGTYTFYFEATGPFADDRMWRLDNLSLEGIAVPAPPALLLLGSALVPLLLNRRRRT